MAHVAGRPDDTAGPAADNTCHTDAARARAAASQVERTAGQRGQPADTGHLPGRDAWTVNDTEIARRPRLPARR